ncbi:hypothetical protein IFM89_009401 [Coptis chinensis]|uniref:Endonuclease/exonuclease/phosphatase n=1 Tax=Coptis chinensis TaxID=261450 RepID=A0A835LIB9_9MAGN|nr:hypothetical protein IFM89_009401 [Coptis chinensis]
MGFVEGRYTWCNNQEGTSRVFTRIDRAICNAPWRIRFPEAKIFHIPTIDSDHKFLVLRFKPYYQKLKRPFRFEAMWLSDPTCQDVVHHAMNQLFNGSPSYTFCRKLVYCRQLLIHWNHTHFGHIGTKLKQIDEQLNQLQQNFAMVARPSEQDLWRRERFVDGI